MITKEFIAAIKKGQGLVNIHNGVTIHKGSEDPDVWTIATPNVDLVITVKDFELFNGIILGIDEDDNIVCTIISTYFNLDPREVYQ